MVTTFTQTIERPQNGPNIYPATPQRKFVVGVDLGQSSDPTATCVLEHRRVPSKLWTVTEQDRGPPTKRQHLDEHFDVRHLQRLPLGMAYPAVVQAVADLMSRPPLDDLADLVIDETGVGRAVADIFDTSAMQAQRVTITAGNEVTCAGLNRWHVAKGVLISTLDARLHTGDLKFAAALQEAEAMREELKDFRRKVSVAGRYTFEARVGKHDDLVLAVAIALWWAVRPPPLTAVQIPYGRF